MRCTILANLIFFSGLFVPVPGGRYLLHFSFVVFLILDNFFIESYGKNRLQLELGGKVYQLYWFSKKNPSLERINRYFDLIEAEAA